MRKTQVGVKYTREALEPIVARSVSMSDVLRAFGKKPQGAVYQHVRGRIKKLGLDTSHFLGKAAKAGPRRNGYREPDVLRDGHVDRVRASTLRRALLLAGRKEVCAGCGLSQWRRKPIRLHIDHINGDWSDCRAENLRFLCPNCHSQTETFGYHGQRASTVIQRIPEEDENVVRPHG